MKNQLITKTAIFGKHAEILAPDLTKYIFASVSGTLTHYVLMIILLRVSPLTVVQASTTGAIGGAMVIYLLNYFRTFVSQKRHMESIPKFFIVATLGLAANTATLKALLNYFDWHYLLIQLLATSVVFGLSFSINRAWTF